MQILIDIPEELYKANLRGLEVGELWDLRVAIKNGTPLQKGHGRLIDADVLDKIRSEIDRQQKWLLQAGYTAYNVDIAFDAIKAVVAESEDKG